MTASEETAGDQCAPPVHRRSLGEVLGDHCLTNLVADSPLGAAPLRASRKKPGPKSTKAAAQPAVSPRKTNGNRTTNLRSNPVVMNAPVAQQGSVGFRSAAIPFSRQNARHESPPSGPASGLSVVMLQLSRELVRTLSGTFNGNNAHDRSPQIRQEQQPTASTRIHVDPRNDVPRHAEPWWERLAPKSAFRTNSARRVSISDAVGMHCIAHIRSESHPVGSREPAQRSASHSHAPLYMRASKGFTQPPITPSRHRDPLESPSRRRSLSAQAPMRRPDGRDASFLRPTEASESRREAAAKSLQTLANSSHSSTSLLHTSNGATASSQPHLRASISPTRTPSSSRALFERLYSHRTESSYRHAAPSPHRNPSPPHPSQTKVAPAKPFVPSCAVRKERSHLAKVYNIPEAPPRAAPPAKKYLQRSKPQSVSPPRQPSPSATSRTRSPQAASAGGGISRGQVLYQQTRAAQIARKQDVIAQAMHVAALRRPEALAAKGNSHHLSLRESPACDMPFGVADPSSVFEPVGHFHRDILNPRNDKPSHTPPRARHETPTREDLQSLFVSTPVVHRSLQESSHRPNPSTPRSHQPVSPYDTAFDLPLELVEGDTSLVAVGIPATMDVL